jgi:hypothetical protein
MADKPLTPAEQAESERKSGEDLRERSQRAPKNVDDALMSIFAVRGNGAGDPAVGAAVMKRVSDWPQTLIDKIPKYYPMQPMGSNAKSGLRQIAGTSFGARNHAGWQAQGAHYR